MTSASARRLPGRSWLGVEPGEGRSTSLMLLHSFFMGCATVFFETAASALFLAQFSSKLLPYVYIVAAVLSTATGIFYSSLRQRVSFGALMSGTLVFLLSAVVALRLGLELSRAAWLVFGLFVFYRLLSILTDLEFWAVATRLYDVRQAKRLFGLIGSGEVVARIVGSFSIPWLVAWLGVDNLIVLSAVALAFCLALFFSVLRTMRRAGSTREEEMAAGEGPTRAKRPPLRYRDLWRTRYLVLVLSLCGLGVLGKYFVDYAFLQQMQSRYTDVKGLAGFFGVFSGVSQVLSLLTRVFLSGRIISQYGIRMGLLVLPMIHLFCTLAVVLQGALLGEGTAIFWLVIVNQGIYKTLKHPIDNASFKVLYQPLRKEQRLAAQIAVEVIVTPVTTGLAGLVMLVFSVIPYHPVWFSAVMLVTFAGWLLVARLASREYPRALLEALDRRAVDQAAFSLDDEASLAVLKQKLGSSDPADVVFALHVLERAEPERLVHFLAPLLGHPAARVRRYALELVARLHVTAARWAVVERIEQEDDVTVRAAALECLAVLGGEDVASRIAPYLTHADARLRKGALIGSLRLPAPASVPAVERLTVLARSTMAAERSLAAEAIGEVGRDAQAGLLLGLLRDDDPEVRRVALVAAGRVKSGDLWPAVIESLAHPLYRDTAVASLVAGGEEPLPLLEARFRDGHDPRIAVPIVQAWGRLRGDRAIRLLAEHVDHPQVEVRHQVLEALSLCGYRADPEAAGRVETLLREEAGDAAWRLATLIDLGDGEAFALLRSALANDLVLTRSRLLFLLSLVYDPASILKARDHLRHESSEKRAYALEILDVTVSKEQAEFILPLVQDLKPEERWRRLRLRFPAAPAEPPERLREILARSERWVRPWTKACAAYTAGRYSVVSAAEAIAALPPSDPLANETARWATARLAGVASGASEEGERPMLAIEKVMILRTVQMFEATREEVLAEVAGIIEEVEVKAGETIFEKGEAGDSMYIIVDGKVRVFDGNQTINHLGERDIFGELALLDPEPRSASVAAAIDTLLFRLDRQTFSELMAGNIEIVRGVLHVLCERLRRRVPAAAPVEAR